MKKFWDERYAEKEFIYGKEPNEFFKARLAELKPGKLLLPCEGEGRNAVYAATQQWEVDALDQSEKGKEKCIQLAKENQVSVNYQISDVAEFDFRETKYDAIALIYAHFPPDIRKNIHEKCVKALKPGGVIILEAFNPLQLKNSSGGPKDETLLYTIPMLKNDFTDLKIKYLENLTTNLKEGNYHSGEANIIRLIAIK
ncbi:MAG: class I SAM-dependent methyltransferase [Bacteroidota bacterium]|nr:class I SAM-dependent methyltransferase [Bacteroidota bacterium]